MAVVGLSPVLIIGMINCLIFFLVVAFYRGDYDLRLMYLLGLFTMAAVLISRIAIESGRAYANAFSLPLAIVSMLAMMRFVTITGPLAGVGWIINVGLLALAWYLADRITFDCTLVDDREKSLQQGLLQSLGLLRRDSVTATKRTDRDHQGTRKAGKRSKKHNPGVWVLYFALLAFPLFGLGQLVIPESGPRQTAFYLLVGYLACALGLLVTTSFVGMRRYLRQRGVVMPAEMSRSWLGTGAVGVILILVVCMILPLPGRSLGLVGLPIEFGSPDDLKASRFGWGSEGTHDQSNPDSARAESSDGPAEGDPKPGGQGNPQASEDADENSPSQSSESGESSQGSPSDSGSKQQGQNGEPANSRSDQRRQQSSENSRQKSDSDEAQGQGANADGSGKGDSGKRERSPEGQSSDEQASQDESSSTEPGEGKPGDGKPEDGNPGDQENPGQDERSQSAARQPEANDRNSDDSSRSSNRNRMGSRVTSWLNSISSSFATLFKWITILVLAAIVIFYVVTHPREIAKLWRELLEFLAHLFGKRSAGPSSDHPDKKAEVSAITQPRRSFSSFANPFSSQLQGWTPAQVVEHTFAALEAWAAERGFERQEDQTAAEFAQQLARKLPKLGREPVTAAHMLDKLMFANWQPTSADLGPLAKLWQAWHAGA